MSWFLRAACQRLEWLKRRAILYSSSGGNVIEASMILAASGHATGIVGWDWRRHAPRILRPLFRARRVFKSRVYLVQCLMPESRHCLRGKPVRTQLF